MTRISKSEKKKLEQSDFKIIATFILVIIAWSCVSSLHIIFRDYILQNVYDNMFVYNIVVFAIIIMILFYYNEYTLEGCGLV